MRVFKTYASLLIIKSPTDHPAEQLSHILSIYILQYYYIKLAVGEMRYAETRYGFMRILAFSDVAVVNGIAYIIILRRYR